MTPLDPTPAGTALPRELVLASAGSGKTYHLSTRILELLAAGAPASEVLASTFTRKAAGEILDRVLLRLAEGAAHADKAEELGGALSTPARCRSLLVALARELHRVNVGTLDSFFIRIARSYSSELGLAPVWTIADRPAADRLRMEAVQQVLAGSSESELAELLHQVNRGAAERSVHDTLVQLMDDLIRIRRQIHPDAMDAWSPILGVSGSLSPTEIRGRAAALAERLRALPVPLTNAGTPVKRWLTARDDAAAGIEALDWGAVFGKGIGAKVLEGAEEYSRHPIPTDFIDTFGDALEFARAQLAPDLRRACEAMGRLATLFEEALAKTQHRRGAYRFEDVTASLGGPQGIASRPDLHYRLDQQVRHILLDEFQDTSFEQWQALAPLVDELLSGHREERAGVIVADPKQSIYGWRGARPELVHQVGERYRLERTTLDRSWRSSPVVLDFVARVFGRLPSAMPLQDVPGGAAVAGEWVKDFTELEAARDLPGHVAVHIGPDDSTRAAIRPALLHFAAQQVRALHEAMPGGSIGVLVRTNKVLAHMMNELGALGVPASGEGGAPLTDTAPVNALLSLLRLADHPSSTGARYHVARSPLGEVVGLTDPDDAPAARQLADRVRRRLATAGYGPTLAAWVRDLAPHCDERETVRLLQLVELGHRWDDRATLRPGDFVRYVTSEAVDDPSSAAVKVMTIHGSKGLEFDAVVLPELYASLTGRLSAAIYPERDLATGWITQVYPSVKKDLLPLFPEIEEAASQLRAANLRDGLSGLYVALTRARHALHLVIPPESTSGSEKTSAGLIRSALGLHDDDASGVATGAHVSPEVAAPDWEAGDPRWFETAILPSEGEAARDSGSATGAPVASAHPAPSLLAPASPRTGRNLGRRSPSALEGGSTVDLDFLLRIDLAPAATRGSIVHAWCEEIAWIDDGLPPTEVAHDRARTVAPGMPREEVDALWTTFRGWMEVDAVRRVLARSAYPSGDGVQLRVECELPFVRRVGDDIQEGIIDRVVLVERDGRVVTAEILDFKTDRIDAANPREVAERVAHYRPQIEAYCDVIRARYALDANQVVGRLIFLEAGLVAPV